MPPPTPQPDKYSWWCAPYVAALSKSTDATYSFASCMALWYSNGTMLDAKLYGVMTLEVQLMGRNMDKGLSAMASAHMAIDRTP